MICLIMCWVWINGTGYQDTCSRPVTVLLETRNYFYVKVEGDYLIDEQHYKIKIDRPQQQVGKLSCKEAKK